MAQAIIIAGISPFMQACSQHGNRNAYNCIPIPTMSTPNMKANAPKVLILLCLTAGLQSACSRSDAPTPTQPATQAALPSPAPLSTEASVTTTAPPVPDRAGPQAVPVATPSEDRMEPASLENARLPGGGQLPADPEARKQRK